MLDYTCADIIADVDITEAELLAWNPWLISDCDTAPWWGGLHVQSEIKNGQVTHYHNHASVLMGGIMLFGLLVN
jgi:hypothetical protein